MPQRVSNSDDALRSASYRRPSYTRYYRNGRRDQWRPRDFRNALSYYYLPSYYNTYGGYTDAYSVYARSPYWTSYQYTPYAYSIARAQQEAYPSLHIVEITTDPKIDPNEWIQNPNRVIHLGSDAQPTYLFCRTGRPTIVDVSAATTSRPVTKIDETYYQCASTQ